MGRLIYSALASLDGYVEDQAGNFDWAAPDDELHQFVNDLERPIGTYLYGRGMYETMAVWETMGFAGEPLVIADFAQLWRVADGITTQAITARDRAPVPQSASRFMRLKVTLP